MEVIGISKEISLDKHRYRIYLFVLIGLLMLFPALLLVREQIQQRERKQIEQFDHQTLTAAKLVARDIGIQIDDYARTLEAFAGQVGIYGSLDPIVLQRMVTAFRSAVPGLAIVYVGSKEGFSIAVDPPFDKFGAPMAGTDYRDRDYYQAVVRANKIFISNVRMGRRAHVPQIQIAAPVLDAEGRFIAYVEDAVDLGDVIQPQADRLIGDMPDLKVVVTDREGRVLAHPEEEARKEMRNLSLDPLFQQASQADGEIRVGKDEKGSAVRAAVAPILLRDLNWRVIAYRPKELLEKQKSVERQETWEIAGAGLVGSLLLAVFAFRSWTKPPSQ
jgi:hypothetical protein